MSDEAMMYNRTNILDFFPEGYDPRSQQKEAILKIADAFTAGARVVVLELPTGGGKSFITQTFARNVRACKGATHFLTIQKILQDQYERDFPAPEIEILKGRNAYACNHPDGQGRDCSDAPCTDQKKGILQECIANSTKPLDVVTFNADPVCVKCPYWHQLLKCAKSPITLFNFSSFLFQQRIGRFQVRELMIVDEAHNIEGQLMNFVELTLRQRDLDLVGVEINREFKTSAELASWVSEVNLLGKIQDKIEKLGSKGPTREGMEDIAADLSHAEHEALQKLEMKVENFLRYLEVTEWIVEVETRSYHGNEEKRIICRPLFASGFAHDLLFSKGRRVLAVSATILNKNVWVKNLGLDPKDVAFIQMGTDFPKRNRPIRLEYVGSMNFKHKSETLPKLVRWIRETLLPRHKGERGIIHCHSFEILEAIRRGVRDPRLIFHERGQDKREVLRLHAKREDSVIVAPAFHEGVDLKDDLSRFQVLAKVPYPSTQDKVIKQRLARDNKWFGWITALKLVQSYGRSVRSKTDYAVTYIVDEGFKMFRARNPDLLPVWFKEALVKYGK